MLYKIMCVTLSSEYVFQCRVIKALAQNNLDIKATKSDDFIEKSTIWWKQHDEIDLHTYP